MYTREGPLDAHGMLLQHAAPLSYLQFARLLASNRPARICASEAAATRDTYITLHYRRLVPPSRSCLPFEFPQIGIRLGGEKRIRDVIFGKWWKLLDNVFSIGVNL